MKCTIPGPNARVLAKAVHSFARIGTDLFIEAQPDGLSMRTVNRTKSAFAMMLFSPSFFSSYDMTAEGGTAVDGGSDAEFANKCKISVKSCLSVFKNMRQVEECRISMDSSNYKLKFEFQCRLEMMKVHYVSVLEQESLQAVYHTEQMPNVLTGSHRLFEEIVSNFQTNEEELTLDASAAELVVKNFVEGATVDRRYMRSQMTIKPDEFESYAIGADTSITFSLRELRAILNFADALSLDMSVNFETAGLPVVFCLSNAESFEANLVMSTLAPDIYNNESRLNHTNAEPSVIKRRNRKQEVPNATTYSVNISTVNDTAVVDSDTMDNSRPASPVLFRFTKPTEKALPVRTVDISQSHRSDIERNRSASHARSIAMPDISMAPAMPTPTRQSLPTTVESDSISLLDSEDVFVEFCGDSEDPHAPPVLSIGDRMRAEAEEANDDGDVIPMSPPPAELSGRTKRRKLMKVFKTCFESTYDPRKAPGASTVLAYGSDEEEVAMRT